MNSNNNNNNAVTMEEKNNGGLTPPPISLSDYKKNKANFKRPEFVKETIEAGYSEEDANALADEIYNED
jgi:hypothetical protein